MQSRKLFTHLLVIPLANLIGTAFLSSVSSTAQAHEIWVPNQGLHKVQIIGAPARRLLAEIAVGKKPHNLAFTADGRYADAANVGSNDVAVIEAATCRVVANIKLGGDPRGVAFRP